MVIIVASGNIFRREFASYILSEAGYRIDEVRKAEALLAALRDRPPVAVVLDLQLEGADPAATLRAVRLLSDAPILWMGEPRRTSLLLAADVRPGALVSWPFQGVELLDAVAALLEGDGARPADLAPRARQVGSAE